MTEPTPSGFSRRPIGAWSFFSKAEPSSDPARPEPRVSWAEGSETLFEAALQANAAALALVGTWSELMRGLFWGSLEATPATGEAPPVADAAPPPSSPIRVAKPDPQAASELEVREGAEAPPGMPPGAMRPTPASFAPGP